MHRLAILLTALALLAACGESPTAAPGETPTAPAGPESTEGTGQDESAPDEDGEDGDGDGDEGADGEAAGRTTTTAWFVRSNDSGFWVEPESAQLEESTLGVARAAIEHMVTGDPVDPGLTTLAGSGVEVLGVNIVDGVLVVDLSGALRDNRSGGPGEEAFAQQLAHTGTQFDGVDAVRLHVDGAAISELWGHLDWSEPVEPDPFALSPITFESHQWGESVPVGDVTVGGQANTFEATVELRLLGPNGDVIEETFTTATSGTGQRGTWEHTFFLEGAATWTIEAVEPDPSGGEGRPPFATTLELRSS